MPLLNQAYDRDNYLDFLAKKFVFSKTLVDLTINNDAVKIFKYLGFITTADKKKLLVFEIHIKPATQLARNRVQLRHLVAREIEARDGDGALAVYVDALNQQWRFSFISIEHIFGEDGVQTKETASKRFTYLLGEGAKTRTATEQFDKLNQQSTLDDLKAAFAVEALSKEFYGKLNRWYETAQQQVKFPNDENAENHIQTSLIRLLTRLLFVWFLKEKKLIDPDLFELAKLKNIIDYQKPSSFYKAILQNLFFATLNRQITDRSFRRTTNGKANNTNYLVTNIYRYKDYFSHDNEQDIMALFKKTPFLNGGLFECLDREATDTEKQQHEQDTSIRKTRSAIRMDGFSDRPDNELQFDNQLLFNDDEKNLGLIDLFNQYQFTVEESTPTDVEVALDPELLGKVFENLLATYNPETKQLARKDSGSFYTPREIVGYMVGTSLKAYLSQAVPPDDGDNEFYQQRLDDLFFATDNTAQLATENGTSVIYPNEIPKLIDAISQIKIIDPAVGSGAFPMGILQRLVALLAILDPDNKQWKAQQLAILPNLKSIEQDIKTSQKINDTQAKQKARAELERRKKQITAQFKQQDHNYLRKLYLIENCIYGVDIQSIAIQICKLRFFISLTIEQNPNDNSDDNYGIKALPNLETKFIVANTLLPLGGGSSSTGQMGLFDAEITKLQQNLAEVRHQYFSAKTPQTKRKYRDKDKYLREEMLETLTQSGISPAVEISMQQVVSWDLYNQNAVAAWFDPEWMFSIKDGFDIVLGNPPYIQVKRKIYPSENFPYSEGKDKGKQNIYKLFTEQSYNLCKDNGIATMIVQSSLMCDLSATATRELLLNKTQLQHIIEFPETAKDRKKQVFESVTQGTCIYQFNKQPENNNPINLSINNDSHTIKNPQFSPITAKTIQQLYPELLYFPKIATGDATILQKIANNQQIKPFSEFILNMRQGDINLTTHSAQFSHSLTATKLMRGKHISRYQIKYYEADEYITDNFKNEQIKANQINCFLISQQVHASTGIRRLHFALQDDAIQQVLYGNSVNKTLLKDQTQSKYYLALLNSKFMDWYFRITSSNNHVQGYEIEQLPIPQISKSDQQPFINLIDKILIAKKTNQDSSALETQIDKLVYKLYNLTTAEIKMLKNEMDKDKEKEEIQTLLQQIRDESSDADYIYRGETQEFPEISSTLYRKYKDEIAANEFDINIAQIAILKTVKEYTNVDKEIDILIELQHHGGKTNLIDFSTDYLIALFFACDAAYNQDGRLILLNKNTYLGNIITPTPASKNSRIKNQKSIFFQPPEGFIAAEKVKIITIKQKLKQPILSYLKKRHITTASIYNDLLGYIQNQDQHKDVYTQFYIGLTHQYKAKEHQQTGKDAEAQEEHHKTIAAYSEAIKLNADDTAIYYNRGNAQVALKQYPEAIADYNTAIELRPDYAATYVNRGLAKAYLGQYQQAIADYNTAIELKPDDAEAYYNRGLAKAGLKQYQEASADYTTAIKLKPDYAAAYSDRGVAKAELGQYPEAIAAYTTAIKLKPDYADAYYNRGNAKAGLKQYQEASADYTKAIELKPDNAEAYNNRGTAQANLRRYQKAIIDHTTAIELKPDNATAYNNRGVAKVGLTQYPEAITDYTTAIELNPDYAEAYYNRGGAQVGLTQYQEAIIDYTTAIKLKPDYAKAYDNRGVAKAGLGQYQKAITDHTAAIELNPDDALAYYNRGLTKEDLEQHQQARADYTVAMDLAKKQGNQALIDLINKRL